MKVRDKIRIERLSFFYGDRPVLRDISARLPENRITAVVGPSGQGKSTFLTTLNRLWEGTTAARLAGSVGIRFGGGGFKDIYDRSMPVHWLRQKVGMVFQNPNPLPMSVYKNAAFPLKLAGERQPGLIEDRVRRCLEQAYLWDEVKDRLAEDARNLSGGQQQRLCIARALILQPEVLLLDEPTSSLDGRAGQVIEDLLGELRSRCTVVMVSHYMDQVSRVADVVMEMADGTLVQAAG